MLQHHGNAVYRASDMNYDLYCFWRSLTETPDELIGGVQEIFDRSEKQGGRSLFSNLTGRRKDNLSQLQRGIDFYILNRITFSGVVDSGGFSTAAFEGRFTQSGIDRLWHLHPLLKQIDLRYADYTELLNMPGKDVMIFLDPPYYSATKSKLYGKRGRLHTEFDHEKLFVDLKNCDHRWLITYDNSPFIRDLYKDHSQLEWQLQYGMTNKLATNKNELLIANFDLGSNP